MASKTAKKAVLGVLGSLFLVGALSASYASAATPAASPYAAMVESLSHGNMRLLKTFPGPDGLTGLVVGPAKGHGAKTIVWGVGEKALIPGPVLNAQGQNLTLLALRSQHLLPEPMATGKLAEAMMQAPGFTVGTKGPLFAVFLDPNCIFCHQFWDKAYPLAQEGKFRFKVVPVGFLKSSSLPKAVTILMQKNPEQAWAENEAKFNKAAEEGGTVPAKNLDPKIVREIAANTQLLAKSGAVATPTFLACFKGQKAPEIFHGMTSGMLSNLEQGSSLTDEGCS